MNLTMAIRESEIDGITRVISRDLTLNLCNLLGDWCKNSERLCHIIGQSLMHSVNDFDANCSLFDIKTFECTIPGWIDTWTADDIFKNTQNDHDTAISNNNNNNHNNRHKHLAGKIQHNKDEYRQLNEYVNDKFVHETQTPIYYFLVNSYAMDKLGFSILFLCHFCCACFVFCLFVCCV